jgi:hypothetical protein
MEDVHPTNKTHFQVCRRLPLPRPYPQKLRTRLYIRPSSEHSFWNLMIMMLRASVAVVAECFYCVNKECRVRALLAVMHGSAHQMAASL